MAQTVNFKKAAKERKNKEEMDKMRELCGQLSDMEKSDPNYDPFAGMDETLRDLDPEMASLIDEDATLYAQAKMSDLRGMGYDVPGTEFEKRRDKLAVGKEEKIARKIRNKMQK